MPIALPALGGLVLVLWVIAFALGIAVIMGYIAGVLHGLPFPLNQLAGPVNALAKGLSDVCYKAIRLAEKLVGAGFHLLASYTDRLWNELVHHSVVSFVVAQIVGDLVHAFRRLESTVAHGGGAVAGLLPRVKTLEREWKGIEAEVKKLARDITGGIGHDLRIQIKALERELHGIEKGVIPGLRAGIKTAEGEVTQLQNFIKAIPGTKYLDWAAGIVAAAIGVEALNLFRCPTFLNKTAKRGCGLWDALEKLLPLVGLLAVGFTFQEFVDAASEVAGGIGSFVGDLEKPFVGELPPLPPPRT